MTTRTAARWAGYVAFAVVFAVACGFLANWQFTRNADREEQLRLVAENYDAAPVALADVVAPGSAFAPGDQWRPVTLRGEYLTDQQLLVRNRPHGGTSAFEVLVPFRTDDGQVLLVDRGWVPPASDGPEPESVPAPPSGKATVIARLMPGEPLPRSGRSAPAGQVPTIHLPTIAASVDSGSAMLTDVYGIMVSEEPAPPTRPQALESPSEDPGPHLSYAIQWILFAVMGFVFIWYMIRTERRHRREDEADGPSAARRGRRRDQDMEAEDELLDAVAPK
ncbi:SURF1 family cytochrome oxidase biogenesis protein [Microbacterium sp. TNHR37B]|uniref:SURF1 family cytochrome oxidase biogenesis protein n=1 Tax=Microbacterium sp. TNHR37B TaxID=1775956 RepID=UPI0007B22E58|nr:SURF1 family protein [Microbacterium sp. TNHR37B]KZE90763.1 putative SURF1-like protein [Microbacterium sp. TNHR37B]